MLRDWRGAADAPATEAGGEFFTQVGFATPRGELLVHPRKKMKFVFSENPRWPETPGCEADGVYVF